MDHFYPISDNHINISDVLEAIQSTDPSFAEQARPDVEMIGVAGPSSRRKTAMSETVLAVRDFLTLRPGMPLPRIEIVEQPASKALRFRYECEGRSAGSIPGVNSTPENKTFPAIRVVGFRGRALVVVSCVTRDPPYRPHPHNLVGKDMCKSGICTVQMPEDTMAVSFDKLGIQCVKRKDIEEALIVRESLKVDPFGTGYDHRRQPTSIDLNAVRLCFQVFLEGPFEKEFKIALKPVVSQTIYDKKAMSDLVICKLSHCSTSVAGGTEMVLLCEKVAKEDIQVRFFEERDGQTYWEGFGDFQPTQVHKQVAIAFRTPSYKSQQVDQPVQVYIQLRRPSDGATSEPLPFQLLPLGLDDPDTLRRKRQKFNNSPNAYVLRHVQAEAEKQPGLLNPFPQYNLNIIKSEPKDRLSPFGGVMAAAPSPPMFQLGNPTNVSGLRPIHSPRRTPSPMNFPMFNIPPAQPQQQNLACQLQPIIAPQGSPSPILVPEAISNHRPENNYQLGDASSISNAIGNSLNIGNVLDNHQPPTELIDLNFPQFDTVDLTSLNISDIVKEGINGDQAAAGDECNALDSFTKMCMLNSLYKSSGNNVN